MFETTVRAGMRQSHCSWLSIACGADLGHGASWVTNQSRMVTMNHRCDSTDGTQNDMSCEKHSAGVLIPVVLSNNQCSILLEEDDQCWQIVRAILTV